MIKILKRKRTPECSGFTLVEILLVIMLIGLVMGALLVNLGSIGGQAEEAIVETFVTGGVKAPVMAYKIKNGKYPSNMSELAPYFEKNEVPKDPWNNSYQFKYPGSHNSKSYDVWSMGPDGQNNTADDIGNW